MMQVRLFYRSAGLLALCLGTMGLALAQGMRDPTQAPREVQSSLGSAQALPDAENQSVREATGMAVVVRDGVPYLVDGTRLYGVGQMLGTAKIERITETEVWLRSGKTLRKLQRFSGIERKPAAKAKGYTP